MRLPSERLDGRHAFVTGAGRGLGRACALALAGAGASVSLVARSADELAEVEEEIATSGSTAYAFPLDVTEPVRLEEAIAAADERAPISILVTAAGTNRTGPTVDYDLADWDYLMDLNVRGTYLPCQAVGRKMIERGDGGSIITMSSQMGTVGYPGRAAYCTTKHAVNGLTKALAVEWAPHRITVNAVAPTFVDTPMTRPMFDDPEFADEVRTRIPGGEIAKIEDVAGAVLYLASDRARAVTGHILAVDAGWTAW